MKSSREHVNLTQYIDTISNTSAVANYASFGFLFGPTNCRKQSNRLSIHFPIFFQILALHYSPMQSLTAGFPFIPRPTWTLAFCPYMWTVSVGVFSRWLPLEWPALPRQKFDHKPWTPNRKRLCSRTPPTSWHVFGRQTASWSKLWQKFVDGKRNSQVTDRWQGKCNGMPQRHAMYPSGTCSS